MHLRCVIVLRWHTHALEVCDRAESAGSLCAGVGTAPRAGHHLAVCAHGHRFQLDCLSMIVLTSSGSLARSSCLGPCHRMLTSDRHTELPSFRAEHDEIDPPTPNP
jgi:hypothetical protein